MAYYYILGAGDVPVGCIQYPGGNIVPIENCRKSRGGSSYSGFGGFGGRKVFRQSVLKPTRLMPTRFKSQKSSGCGGGCCGGGCSK